LLFWAALIVLLVWGYRSRERIVDFIDQYVESFQNRSGQYSPSMKERVRSTEEYREQ
jgi:hypothetical protein